MKIGICDDEPQTLETLRSQLMQYMEEQNTPFPVEISLFRSGKELLFRLKEETLDLVFLDIELETESGIRLAGEIYTLCPDCKIAYCTNYLEYSTEVYETEHCYYILKGEFSKRLPFVIKKILNQNERSRVLLPVQVSGYWENIAVKEILYIERRGKKTCIFLERDREVEISEKLDAILLALPEKDFIRCHKSYIIAFDKIKTYARMSVIMKNGVSISISRPYINSVREGFACWSWERM